MTVASIRAAGAIHCEGAVGPSSLFHPRFCREGAKHPSGKKVVGMEIAIEEVAEATA